VRQCRTLERSSGREREQRNQEWTTPVVCGKMQRTDANREAAGDCDDDENDERGSADRGRQRRSY
jgi:hypothetical protein